MAKKKARRGRPVGSGPGAREESLFVRLSAEEHATINAAAEKIGLPAATWARLILLRAAASGDDVLDSK